MEATYNKAIENAASKLNELYFLSDSVLLGYEDMKAGFILGIATTFHVTPQRVQTDIENCSK